MVVAEETEEVIVYENELFTVTDAESELVITGTGQTSGTLKLITTKSVAVFVPLVQLRVRVVGVVVDGYQACPGTIGPPTPVSEMPELPVGEVSVQAVAPVEVQLYE